MNAKTLRVIPVAAMLTLLMVGFQNCGKARFTSDTGAASMKASGSSDDPSDTASNNDPVPADFNHGTLPADNPEEAFSGACAIFKDLDLPDAVPADAHDVVSERSSSPMVIPLALNVIIKNASDRVLVDLAETATLLNLSGGLNQVRAAHIPSAMNISGHTCLIASDVGQVEKLSAGTKIIANSIDHIVNNSGDLHIYRAVVNHVSGSSGRICLHDGASVVDYNNVSGGIFVGKCH
jgi:hypothetical protein